MSAVAKSCSIMLCSFFMLLSMICVAVLNHFALVLHYITHFIHATPGSLCHGPGHLERPSNGATFAPKEKFLGLLLMSSNCSFQLWLGQEHL